MAQNKIVIDASKLKADINEYKASMSENLRLAMLEAMQLVGINSVAQFMEPHILDKGEFGRPGGKKRISIRSGGYKLGILTGRLSRSILDQEDPEYGRESIRKVVLRLNSVIGIMGSKVPYAKIHEKGGTANIFGTEVQIQPRPYLQPSATFSMVGITAIFEKRMNALTKKVF